MPRFFEREDWMFYGKMLADCVDRFPDMDLVELIESIKHEEHQLWALMDETMEVQACVVTAIQEYRSGYKVMHLMASGTAPGWFSTPDDFTTVVGDLEHVAEVMECDAFRITGRPGWARIFKDYTEVERVFDKRLKENSDGR